MEMEKIMFKEIRLVSLFIKANAARNFSYDIKNKYWYRVLKPEMMKLVGFEADKKELRTTEIYENVYSYCMSLMEL